MAFTPDEEIKQRANQIHAILLSHGYSKESSTGVIGNLIVETAYTLNPTINENGGGGYGLGQWTPKENVYKQGNALGLSNAECDTIDGQAKIIAQGDVTGQWFSDSSGLSYPNNPTQPLNLSDFKNFTNIDQSTVDFMAHWERPSEILHHLDWRLEASNVIFPFLTGGGVEICYDPPIIGTNMDKSSFMSEQLYGFSSSRPNNFHNGLDFGSIDHPGSNMCAICDGEIVKIGNNDVSGLHVWYVLRGENYDFHYWESASSISDINVSVGQKVKKGDVLSNRTRDHLHISITKNRDFMGVMSKIFIDDGTWIDPLSIIGTCEGGGITPPEPPEKPEFSVIEIRQLLTNVPKEEVIPDIINEMFNRLSVLLYSKTGEDVEPQLLSSEFSGINLYDNFGNSYEYQIEYLSQKSEHTLIIHGGIGESNKVHYTFKEYCLFNNVREEYLFNYGIMDSSPRTITILSDRTDSFMQANKNQVEAQSRTFNENKDMLQKSINLSNKGVELANSQATYNSNFAIDSANIGLVQSGIGAVSNIATGAMMGGVVGGGLAAINSGFNVYGNVRNVQNANQQGEFTEQNNSMRSQSNALSNMQAKLGLSQNIRSYNASIKDLDNQPSSILQIGSDMSFLSGNDLDLMLISYNSGNKTLLELANNYIKSYGVIQNKYYQDLNLITYQRRDFNYVKCSTVSLNFLTINASHLNALKAIFVSGVRIWNYNNNDIPFENKYLNLLTSNPDL